MISQPSRAIRFSGIGVLLVMLHIHLAFGQDKEIQKLKELSIEELLTLEVTSVSRGQLRLTEAASAVQVITREDIRRSAATNIPEALRLASNLQVAQLNSSAWVISARGFNTVFANKLLVLIDGRTVYTPLFAGVLWNQQHVLLEDVERIEVISGPGGSLWGANAVNGVINIITRGNSETKGLYATVAAGDFLERKYALRYGGELTEKTSYRVYGTRAERGGTFLPAGTENNDDWNATMAGFRLEFAPRLGDNITVQAEHHFGERFTEPASGTFDGQFIRANWNHTISEGSDLDVQIYFDRYWTDDPTVFADELVTYDFDLQHRLRLGQRHNFLWGVGYRHVMDHVINRRPYVGLLPERRTMPLYSAFVQDEVRLNDELLLTVGTKLLHNFYSGLEFQPTARMAWNIRNRNHTVWVAAARAVRAPSRLDRDYYLPLEPQPPNVPSVAGGPNFQSENLHAFELGFRSNPARAAYLSLSTFFNDYRDVYSNETLPGTMTYQIQNGSDAETWGAEFHAVYQPFRRWILRAGYTYFDKDLRAKPGRDHDPSYLANDARNIVMAQSMLSLPGNLQLDIIARYVDYLPATFATAEVSEYFTFDARFAWQYRWLEFAVCGQNIRSKRHAEFGTFEIPRSFYGKVTCRL